MADQKLLAVDPSLSCSGWALFSIQSKELLGVGNIRGLSTASPMAVRLQDVQSKVTRVLEQIDLGANDVLICEAVTTMRDPRGVIVVEQVRGIFETLARTRAVCVPGRINPRTVQHELLGLRGKQLEREHVKAIACKLAWQLFEKKLAQIGFAKDDSALAKNQDIADALLLGQVALARLDAASSAGIDPEEFFEQFRQTTKRFKANSIANVR